MSNASIKSRTFLVGCARSGTTLLQALLAAHPAIVSFPETQYFSILIGMNRDRVYGHKSSVLRDQLKRLRLALGIALPRSGKASRCARRMLIDTGHEELAQEYPSGSMIIGAHAHGFQKLLDKLTLMQGKHLWLEKSPNHLYYINEIERYIDRPRFVHLVREGRDVVASICDAARKYPTGNDFSIDVDDCISRWNSAARITHEVMGRSNHHVVYYERLVQDTETELRRITDFLDIPYHDVMLNDYTSHARSLIRGNEEWKSSVSEEIQTQRSGKFYKEFDEKTRARINSRLVDLDWPCK